jgi:beta-glucosidase/6-phospho-beta-glucosidase/beta-galactosidase
MYTSLSGKRPDAITPEQIAAFVKYIQFVVGHFRGRIQYYALWNEHAMFNASMNTHRFVTSIKLSSESRSMSLL